MTSTVFAQKRTINFNTSSLQEAFKLAKSQHKMIFADCYTQWCVPCKGMEKNVFALDSIADFFNSHFINVKLDMEKGEGPAAIKAYLIGAFPTYLLFDEDGKQIYKFVGGMSAEEFMAKIRIGINPENEIAERDKLYAAGNRDHALLRALIKQKFNQKEPKSAQKVTAEYFNLLSPSDRVKQENWFMFAEGYDSMFISDIGSTNFSYLLANYNAFVTAIGQQKVDDKINAIFKKLTGNAMVGYYFKNHPFDKDEFDTYKKAVLASDFPDKKQLMVLLDIAIAAGLKDVKAAGKLLADHVDGFTQKNKDVVFDYTNFCSTTDRSYPYINEIYLKVARTSKNTFLIKHCKDYTQRIAVQKSSTNE